MDEKFLRHLINIKENVETTGFALPSTVNQLIGVIINNADYVEILNRQLEHAVLTGGEYLPRERIKSIN